MKEATSGRGMDRRCCVEAVLGTLVGLVMEWFIMGVTFKPYPPDCIVINQGLVEFDLKSGMVTVTNKTATIRSYVDTPGLKVEYRDIYVVLKLGAADEHDQVVQISSRVKLDDVSLCYERFSMWPLNFSAYEFSVEPIKPHSLKGFILQMDMKMQWFSFWSVRFGSFEKVMIICPMEPEHINIPIQCVSRSS